MRRLLDLPRRVALRRGVRLYLVGGAIRDLLLGAPLRDLDLVVEGDAVSLAGEVARELGVAVRTHRRFGTATVEIQEGRLDFATARRETYHRPGALPRVERAPIEEDLGRRDFTIHAMALEIAPVARTRPLDPFGGRDDLSKRRLRVLHPRSFEDDPTRAYRAARYGNRLRFSIERGTRRASLTAVAKGCFETISGDRRRRELRLLFSEPRRAGAVRQMARLGLPQTLHPALSVDATVLSNLRKAERLANRIGRGTSWILYLLVWAFRLRQGEVETLADRLSATGEERRVLLRWPGAGARLFHAARPPRPSEVARLRFSEDEMVAAAVCSTRADVSAVLGAELARQPVELSIGGRDLLRAGILPGPSVGKALARTLAARRDGEIPREGELEYALEAARRSEAP